MLKGSAFVAASAALPAAALAQSAPGSKGPKLLEMDGKAKLHVLGDRPLVAEAPAALLDDDVTPTEKLFVRNNGQFPEMPADLKAWKIKIDGEVNTPLEITLGDLGTRDGMLGGINAVIVGNYLTTLGRSPEEDLALLGDLGMPVKALSQTL